MANSEICKALLQRARDAKLSGDAYTTSSGIDLCDEEIDWLENAGYIEVVKRYTHGAQFRITDRGDKFIAD